MLEIWHKSLQSDSNVHTPSPCMVLPLKPHHKLLRDELKWNKTQGERPGKKKRGSLFRYFRQDYLNLCCDFLGLGEDTDISWVKEAPRKSEVWQKLWITHFFLVALKIGTTGKTKKSPSLLKHNKTKGYSAVMVYPTANIFLNIFRAYSFFNITWWLCFSPNPRVLDLSFRWWTGTHRLPSS